MDYLLYKLDTIEYYHLTNPSMCQTGGGGVSTLQGHCNYLFLANPADLSVESSPNTCAFTVWMYQMKWIKPISFDSKKRVNIPKRSQKKKPIQLWLLSASIYHLKPFVLEPTPSDPQETPHLLCIQCYSYCIDCDADRVTFYINLAACSKVLISSPNSSPSIHWEKIPRNPEVRYYPGVK